MDALSLAIVGSVALAAFHLIAPVLEFLPIRYRDSMASFSGGAGLAYVFLYLLYELATEGAPKIHSLAPMAPDPLESLFVLILAALTFTYVVQVQLEKTPDPRDDHRGYAVLFLIYNVLAGAGLVEEASWGAVNLSFYVAAIGLHLLFNDRFLGHCCSHAHSWWWRAALAVAPPLGCAVALATDLPAGVLYILLALVAGGTIINVLHREIPESRIFRPISFTAGVAGYAALIFATWRF